MAGIDNIFGIHEHALLLRGKRMEMIANNISNADTPGYKAKDIDFKSVLAQQASSSTRMTTTHEKHINVSSNAIGGGDVLYRTPMQPSIDGNTVEIDVEKAQFAKNTIEYQATFSFLNGKIKSLMSAIKGQ